MIRSSNGHNIFGSDVEGNVGGDLEGVPASLVFAAIDPMTGAGLLGDHGGPTRTIALHDDTSNPALGGAEPWDSSATDQRGAARPSPVGTDPDIGAFEHPWLHVRDGLDYIASYDDLIRVLGPDATAGVAHYRTYGAAESRQVSFDGLEYIASYEDLIQALGPNGDVGAVHFIRHGAAEGRPRDEFDEVQYLKNYSDLQAAFGNDTEAATVHYIRYGHAEGRTDEPVQAAADFLV